MILKTNVVINVAYKKVFLEGGGLKKKKYNTTINNLFISFPAPIAHLHYQCVHQGEH